jgi:hypothetical protein
LFVPLIVFAFHAAAGDALLRHAHRRHASLEAVATPVNTGPSPRQQRRQLVGGSVFIVVIAAGAIGGAILAVAQVIGGFRPPEPGRVVIVNQATGTIFVRLAPANGGYRCTDSRLGARIRS